MLCETAARAGEVLALNVEDLDLPRKRAVITGKGGQKEYVFWASGAARLLSRYLAGRRRGPNVIPARGTNAHTPAREDCPTNAPPPYSSKQVAGGHSTTPHSPTSARKEPPPSCSRPRADSQNPRTLAIYTKRGNEAIAHLTSAFDKKRSDRCAAP